MEQELKLAIGRMIGETLRVQKRIGENICRESDATIYGLINGLLPVIDEYLASSSYITAEDIENASSILQVYYIDPEKRNSFSGYYQIEHELEARGIDRWKARRIFTYFKANYQFVDLLEKMDTAGSPGECRTFEIDENEV